MSDFYALGPDFFAMRELAVTRAIKLNRDLHSVSLFDFPPVMPPPAAELNAVWEAHARATALGLTIPPFPRTIVHFVKAPPSAPQGGQTRERNGVCEMRFPIGQPLDALRHVALHELMHVHQHATGDHDWLSWESGRSKPNRSHGPRCRGGNGDHDSAGPALGNVGVLREKARAGRELLCASRPAGQTTKSERILCRPAESRAA